MLAHRALWASPSHRDNMLQPRFDRVGVGVCTDPDGSVWVTEAFATPLEYRGRVRSRRPSSRGALYCVMWNSTRRFF